MIEGSFGKILELLKVFVLVNDDVSVFVFVMGWIVVGVLIFVI